MRGQKQNSARAAVHVALMPIMSPCSIEVCRAAAIRALHGSERRCRNSVLLCRLGSADLQAHNATKTFPPTLMQDPWESIYPISG